MAGATTGGELVNDIVALIAIAMYLAWLYIFVRSMK